MLTTSSLPLHFVFFLPHPSIAPLVLGPKSSEQAILPGGLGLFLEVRWGAAVSKPLALSMVLTLALLYVLSQTALHSVFTKVP